MTDCFEAAPKTILHAEDDEIVRGLMAKVLTRLGYKLIPAVDGQDAIAQFLMYREEIRLVLLDVLMPKKNGMEAFNEIRKIQPEINVIFCSACPEAVLQAHGGPEDGVAVLSKPVDMNKLVEKIREMLG
jgi:CheY-like chemotaxis protein